MLKLTLLLLPAVLLAQDTVEFTGRYWITNMASTVRVGAPGFATDLDAKRDLGVPDTNFPAGNFTWNHENHKMRFDYTPIELGGDQTVTRNVLFGGNQYTVGTRVVSDLQARHLQLSWEYQGVNIRDGLIRFGPVLEANGFLLRAKLDAPALSLTHTETMKVGAPAAGALVTVHPRRDLEIYSQVTGIKMGDYGSYISSDSGVKFFWRQALVTAGYRTLNLDASISNDTAHLRLRGVFLGAGFRF